MPNLWLFNMDEEAQGVDPLDAALVCRNTNIVNVRNLFNLSSEDVAVLSHLEDTSFVEYVNEFTGGKVFCASSTSITSSGSLIDSFMNSNDLIERLQNYCANAHFTCRPYIQTSKAVAFSQMVGGQWDGTSPRLIEKGLISQANSKLFIKSLATSCGIKVAPYAVASNLSELLSSIDEFGSHHRHVLFLKKDGMCGGMGNLSGTVDDLKMASPLWYHSGRVILEPRLPVYTTLGSIFDIQPHRIEMVGVDKQFFNGCRWGGFTYPCDDEKAIDVVRDLSFQMANLLKSMGLYGPANFDWLVLASDYPEAGLCEGDVVLSECNFRYTGVYPTLKFAQRYFGADFSKIHIATHVLYPIGQQYSSFASLYERLSMLDYHGRSLMCQPSALKCCPGVLISRPPANNTCGITFFAYDQGELAEYSKLVAEAIS